MKKTEIIKALQSVNIDTEGKSFNALRTLFAEATDAKQIHVVGKKQFKLSKDGKLTAVKRTAKKAAKKTAAKKAAKSIQKTDTEAEAKKAPSLKKGVSASSIDEVKDNEQERNAFRAKEKVRAMLKQKKHLKKEIAAAAFAICPKLATVTDEKLYWTKFVRRTHRSLEKQGIPAGYAIGKKDSRALSHSGVYKLKVS